MSITQTELEGRPPLARMTAAAAMAVPAVSLTVTMPLFFVGDATSLPSVLTRHLADAVACVLLVLFLVGWRSLVVGAQPGAEWLGTAALALGVLFTAVTLAAGSDQAGAVIAAGGGIDPTRVGSGGEAGLLSYGPTARLVTGVLLLVMAAGARAANLLPPWLTRAAVAVAGLHLVLVGSAFGGTDPADFAAINGWGIPVAGGLFLLWVAATGVILLRRR